MSVATLQAIEDRSNFYRLDWRLLSPFVLTLVHLGKDILTQATFGTWDAVRVGWWAEDVSVIEPLQPVSLPLSFVLSESNTLSDLLHDMCPGFKCDHSLRAYLYFFAVLYFWHVLIRGAHNLVCFNPLIISKNQVQRQEMISSNRSLKGGKKHPLTPSTTQKPLLSGPNMLL